VRLWTGWLVAAALVVLVLGAAFVFAAGPVQEIFGSLYLGPQGKVIDSQTAPYVEFIGAVLGAVMFGWAVLLLFVVRGPFRSGERIGWDMIAASLGSWFVLDTAYSLVSGYWQNAVLNTSLFVLFAIPLAATYRHFRPRRT